MRHSIPRLLVGALAAYCLLGLLHSAAPAALPDAPFAPYPVLGAQLAASLLVVGRGIAAAGRERWGWALLGAGLVSWWLGDVFWFSAGDDEAPIPSWGDAGYLACIPLTLAGVGSLAAARGGRAPRALWIDGLVAALAAAAVSAAVVFEPVAAQATGSTLEVATNLAYPIGDLALLAVVVGVVALRGWRLERTWVLIGLGVAAFWTADAMYLITSAAGTYEVGAWFDLGWFGACILFAAAAWWAPAEAAGAEEVAVEGLRLTVIPTLFAVVSLGLLVASGWHGSNGLAVALAGASLGVVLLRLVDANRLNGVLLRATRQEARTDALTGLGNRRALTDDLERAAQSARPDRPVHLVLFDLDGFKHYNDTFGHPAGDSLLARLAANLRGAVAGRGTAYRMGGDEFCVLLTRPTWRTDLAATVAALTERGEGFSIGASHGMVSVPGEVATAADALQRADQRMYSAKHGGRPPAGRQSADLLLRVLAEKAPDLAEHTEGVADLAEAVAARLGLPREEQRAARHAGELHDVGKVAIPDAILGKPGPLDEQEWTFMRAHTVVGERIVAADPALAAIGRLVRSSHERWDGGGYPDGLAGTAIPLLSRIVAVCDAWDAMTSHRPYRAARDPEEAEAELAAGAGSQFDPAVVEAFLAVRRAARDTVALAA